MMFFFSRRQTTHASKQIDKGNEWTATERISSTLNLNNDDFSDVVDSVIVTWLLTDGFFDQQNGRPVVQVDDPPDRWIV